MTTRTNSIFLPPHPDYITVALLGSGYAAIHMRWYDDMNAYDVQETGFERCATRQQAEYEARDWALVDEMELRL